MTAVFENEVVTAAKVRYLRVPGLTAMCVGLGMGATVIWENPNWEGNK